MSGLNVLSSEQEVMVNVAKRAERIKSFFIASKFIKLLIREFPDRLEIVVDFDAKLWLFCGSVAILFVF